MKALDLLKILNEYDRLSLEYDILDIEELMKSKTCDGCIYSILDEVGEIEDCISHERCTRYFINIVSAYDMYEPKDKEC
jgi:hypothetical protein